MAAGYTSDIIINITVLFLCVKRLYQMLTRLDVKFDNLMNNVEREYTNSDGIRESVEIQIIQNKEEQHQVVDYLLYRKFFNNCGYGFEHIISR